MLSRHTATFFFVSLRLLCSIQYCNITTRKRKKLAIDFKKIVNPLSIFFILSMETFPRQFVFIKFLFLSSKCLVEPYRYCRRQISFAEAPNPLNILIRSRIAERFGAWRIQQLKLNWCTDGPNVIKLGSQYCTRDL